MKKRIFSCILILMILISSNSVAFADDKNSELSTNYDTYTSEYDMYVKIKENANNKVYLKSIGFEKKIIDEVLDGEVEKELLRRKSLPNEELHNMGYKDRDIKVLQSYNGEPIEKFAKASSIMGGMYTKMNVPTKTDDVMSIKLAWWWDKNPICMLTDTIGATWWGNKKADLQLLTSYAAYPTKCIVDYRIGGASGKIVETKKIKAVNIGKDHIIYNIKMPERSHGPSGFAFNGCLYVSVGTKGKHSIEYFHFKSDYAHEHINISGVSAGLDYKGTPSVGLSVASGYKKAMHRHVSIIPWGAVTKEDDDV